jgi:hypothetical protein
MFTSLRPPRGPVMHEDEPRILSVRDLSWPVSVSFTLPTTHPRAKGVVSCVVPRHVAPRLMQPARCSYCGHPSEVV